MDKVVNFSNIFWGIYGISVYWNLCLTKGIIYYGQEKNKVLFTRGDKGQG